MLMFDTARLRMHDNPLRVDPGAGITHALAGTNRSFYGPMVGACRVLPTYTQLSISK